MCIRDSLSIYLPRILMCEQAAKFLGQHFELFINDRPVNNRAGV